VDAAKRQDGKTAALAQARALNPRPAAVADPAFSSGNPFFDRRDLVQVKYEMVRRVRSEGQRVSRSAAAFGFSRPSYYAIQAAFDRAGLPGLLPRRLGPRRAHKLSEEVMDFLEQRRAGEPAPRAAALAALIAERFGLRVHPRSIERALERARKKRSQGSTPS